MGMGRKKQRRRRENATRRKGTRNRTGEWRGGRGSESISEPPLLACRVLMNANHDPEAARSTCCFPVQIAYNFYCHGRNSSLMEARLISSVLVLRPSRVPCVLLPSPCLQHPLCYTLAVGFPSSMSLRAVSHPLPRLSASLLLPLSPSPRFRFHISFSILLDQRHRGRYAGRIYEEYDGVLPALYCYGMWYICNVHIALTYMDACEFTEKQPSWMIVATIL